MNVLRKIVKIRFIAFFINFMKGVHRKMFNQNGEPTAGTDPAQTASDPQNGGNDPQNSAADPKGTGADPAAAAGDPPASYTQADLDKAVAEAITKANEGINERIANAVAEAQRLAQLPDKERKAEEARIDHENFEREKAAFAAEKLSFFAERQLTAAGLPASFAGMVVAADEKTTQERIDSIAKEYKGAVDAGVAQRMKGTPPRGGAGTNAGGGTKTLQDEINAAMKMNI
ncbi:MAG: DUF4355 domain-containing protein [Candidatus Ornithomonoglobus sp.]